MKKSLKKVLAVILSAVMLLSCSATSVFAQGSSVISLIKTVKDVVDYGKSLSTLGTQTVKTVTGAPGRIFNLGKSVISFEKAKGDLTKAVIKDGITTITLPVKLIVSGVKQGGAVVGAVVDTGSGSVKFVIALAQQPVAIFKDGISFAKLGSAVTSGLATGLVNDVKLGVNGIKVANSAKDLVTPSLSNIIEGIKFPIRAGTAVKNVIEIAKGDEDENAKTLTGTAMITDHGEELAASEEETELTAEEEEASAAAAASTAVVANTDGPMD